MHPQPETYWGNVNPVGPRGVYDEAKRFAEAMTMAYHRAKQVDTRIVRIFNTYGPRMRVRDGRVVPAFIQQALTGEPLTVFGDGSQTRSFCFVSDLVRGLMALADCLELLGTFGIPVDRTTWASLGEAAARHGCRVPPERQTSAMAEEKRQPED